MKKPQYFRALVFPKSFWTAIGWGKCVTQVEKPALLRVDNELFRRLGKCLPADGGSGLCGAEA